MGGSSGWDLSMVVRRAGRPREMKLALITLVLCTCALVADADIIHVKAAKAKLIGRLAGKHHKRGILTRIPTYKLGYDIPLVHHSVVKPLVVTYPPTATVAAVKIPVPHLSGSHFPVPVGHKVHGLPHPHYGLKFPHTEFVKPYHDFHHHHHHVAPSPIVPVPLAPVAPASVIPIAHTAPASSVIPLAQPTATISHPVSAPSTPFILPSPAIQQNPLPLAAPPLHYLQQNFHLKSLIPAATVPLQSSDLPLSQPVPYVVRPGGAIQTSVFATYPRHPIVNSYQAPILPLSPTHLVSPVHPLLASSPNVPQFNIVNGGETGVIQHHIPNLAVDQTPLLHPTQVPQPDVHLHPTSDTLPHSAVHLHPTQLPQPAVHIQPTHSIPLDHDGWSPVTAQPHEASHPEVHYPNIHHFAQEQGTQVYEHHDDQFHDYQHQLQQHIQQIEQAQYEQSLNNQHNIGQDYGTPQQDYGQPNEYSQQGQDVSQQHEYQQHNQDFSQHGHDISHQGHDFSQQGHDFSQQGQDFSQHNFAQNNFDYSPHNQYGLPNQGVEGRSGEDNNDQFHNHIPLSLQPPLDRPLDHFL